MSSIEVQVNVELPRAPHEIECRAETTVVGGGGRVEEIQIERAWCECCGSEISARLSRADHDRIEAAVMREIEYSGD